MIFLEENITKNNDMSQILPYNNPLFYCFAHTQSFTSDAPVNVSEHWHEDIEFSCILKGELEYIVNGEKLTLHAGEGICVNSKRIHANHSAPGKSGTLCCVIIHPSYLSAAPYIEQKYVQPMLSSASFDYLLLSQNDWTKKIQDDILHLFQPDNYDTNELEILETAFRALRVMHQNINLNEQRSVSHYGYSAVFKQMMVFIQNHYMEKISLKDIADSGDVGKTLCAKIFRKYTNKTPGEYLIHYRIMKSIELLSESDKSITEIAYAVGFTGASHYTQTFKEKMGCTPNRYRKNSSV